MGHLFRALTLADGLRQRGLEIIFLLNDDLTAQKLISKHGFHFEIVRLKDVGNWETELIRRLSVRLWINDRLNTDIAHAQRIKALGLPLVTFDDQGEGATLADLNVAALLFNGVNNLGGTRVLQGHNYLVLNPEIESFRRLRLRMDSLLVTLGGSDTYGVTVKVVRKLAALGKTATVIVGPSFAHNDALEAAMTEGFELKRGVPSMIAEFNHHDLAITGCGITPFEAAASGLPCIVIANEGFEVPVGRTLQNIGTAVFAGHHENIDWQVLLQNLALESMSRTGLERIGLNGRNLVVDAIVAYL